MNLYKKCTAKPCSFSVIDTTLALDNPLHCRKNLLERIQKPTMTTDNRHYQQVKLINMNILQAKIYYLLIKVE